MNISKDEWINYVQSLNKINSAACTEMLRYMSVHADADGLWNEPDTRAALIDYAYGLSTKYGSAAAELVCQLYDGIAIRSNESVPEAEPAETPNYAEVRAGVNGALSQSKRADVTASAVGRQVKKAAVRTVKKNADRDNAQIAWIPQGNETCAFCIMLASRGWMNARGGNYAEHIHANCDCMLATRFNSNTEYEGYDPDVYQEMYENAEGDTWQEKVNDMSRTIRETNKEKINSQKKVLYAENKTKINTPSRVENIQRKDSFNRYYDKTIFKNAYFKTGEKSPEEYALSKMRKDIDKYDSYGMIKMSKEKFEKTSFSDIEHLQGKLSNYDVRIWYNSHVESIKEQISSLSSFKEQAHMAFDLRNQYRTEARLLMNDQSTVTRLNEDKRNLTFEELVDKANRKGLYGDDAYRDIIRSSMHHNELYDKKAGL